MANSQSARKRIRTAERNRQTNKAARTFLRTQVKRFRAAVSSGDTAEAGRLLIEAHSAIDRTARVGAIHARTASRYKSRLALAHGRLTSAPAAS